MCKCDGDTNTDVVRPTGTGFTLDQISFTSHYITHHLMTLAVPGPRFVSMPPDSVAVGSHHWPN